jgi:hypothetical protein
VFVNIFSDQHIDARVVNVGGAKRKWRFPLLAKIIERGNSWTLLRWLKGQSDLPWLCGGDFNEILSNEEYFGTNERVEW